MWLVGVVVRRYINFLILLIPAPFIYAFLAAASLLFVHFFILTYVTVLAETNLTERFVIFHYGPFYR